MYMQHKHMVYVELHIYHYLVLDQTVNDNSYSTPLRHEVCNVYHKMAIMVIDLCYNIFSYLGVQHQNYPEHDTVCLYIFFPWTIYCISLVNDNIFAMLLYQMVLKFLNWTYIIFLVASVSILAYICWLDLYELLLVLALPWHDFGDVDSNTN